MAGFKNVLGGISRFFVKKKYQKVLGSLSPLIDGLVEAVEKHDLNLDELVNEIARAVLRGEKFDAIQKIGRDYLKREGKELRDEALGALINSIQIRFTVKL